MFTLLNVFSGPLYTVVQMTEGSGDSPGDLLAWDAADWLSNSRVTGTWVVREELTNERPYLVAIPMASELGEVGREKKCNKVPFKMKLFF